jgi:hypothetical protein
VRLIAAAPGAGCRAPAVHAEVWMSSEAKTESKGMGDSGGECCNFWRGRAGNSLSRSSERVRLTEKPVNHDDAKQPWGRRDAGEKSGVRCRSLGDHEQSEGYELPSELERDALLQRRSILAL